MLVLGVLGKLGLYTNGVEQMMKWHVFFSLSWGGIILGMLEGAVFSFAIVYLFAWVYGKLS
ncbi:hypothetical protein GOV03_05265 [Candidatus Woesearchaeota archaeon]|nr:hypothetical protein [Candidatus Woesearchaeota archaeon]